MKLRCIKAILTAVAMAGSLFLVTGYASANTSHATAKATSATAGYYCNPRVSYCCPNGRLADASQPSRRGVLCIRHCPPVYHPTARYRYCVPYCPPGYRLQSNGRYWYCLPYRPWPPHPTCYPRPGYRCPLPEVTRHNEP